MTRNPNCFFCKEVEDNSDNILKSSRIVFQTKNFIVLPTEGCFKIGYLLILPKQHYLCFGELKSDMIEELENLIERISNYIQNTQGTNCIIFEHGTRDLKQLTSTSIMHAHIHILPFEKELIDFLPDYCELKKIKGFTDLKHEKNNYLFLKDINNHYYIVKNNDYPSQFFRQISCKALNIPKYWDWRKYSFIENMKITIDYYDKL